MEELFASAIGIGAILALIIAPIATYVMVRRGRDDQRANFEYLRRELDRLRREVAARPAANGTAPAPTATAPPAARPTPPAPRAEEVSIEELMRRAIERSPSYDTTPPIRDDDDGDGDDESVVWDDQELEDDAAVPAYEPAGVGVGNPASAQPKYAAFGPAPPEEPYVPSQFETAARETLGKIWSWIIVGEEHTPEGVSMEYAVASQWLLRIGVLILVIGIGFFLRYSIEHGYIGPPARVALTTITGLAMLVIGTRILGRQYHVLGQGLLGAGLSTLYFSVYAAANLYHLVSPSTAFALMGLVTVLAGGIAVRFDSMLVAVLGVIGGYGTPVMLSSGVVNFPLLLGYLLVLGIGVLAICYWKNWPLVNYLSFAATYGLTATALADSDAWTFRQVFPFLVAYFVLFSTMTFLYKLVRRDPSNLLDLLALVANAGVFFAMGGNMIDDLYGRKAVAVLSASLAAFYTAHVFYFLRRRLVDRNLLVCFMALAVFFLAITMPLALSRQWITASWAIQAVVLLWAAGKLGSHFVRQLAFLLFAVVLGRFLFFDLGREFGGGWQSFADVGMRDYLAALVERVIAFGVPIGSFALASWMVSRQSDARRAAGEAAAGDMAVAAANDTPAWLASSSALQILLAAGCGLGLCYLYLELNGTVGYFYAPLRLPALTLVLLGLCSLVLWGVLKTESPVLPLLLVPFIAVVLIKLLTMDLPSWNAEENLLYMGPYSFRDALMRAIDFGALIGFLAVAYSLLAGRAAAAQVRPLFGFTALAMLFIYLTLEVNTFLHEYRDGFRSGGVSILWSIFALTLIIRGIAKNAPIVRYLGLGLFTVVAVKTLFFDLAQRDPFYRIIAFVLLGVLMLAGSFVYLKYREKFTTDSPKPQKEPLA